MSRLLVRRPLVCHPDTPCTALAALGVTVSLNAAHGLDVEFVAIGDPFALVVPADAPRVHTDNLWKTTCFELFIAQGGDAYVELNISPSSAFAAYHFDHYRTGMKPLDMPPPDTELSVAGERLAMAVRLTEDDLPWDAMGRIGICAVIEERGGAMSYWALAHPPGKPDFHHRDCFDLTLAPLLDR